MNRSRKSPKKPTSVSEARRTNVLLEAIHKEIRVLAENFSTLRSELGTVKLALHELAEEIKVLKAAVQATTKAIQELRTEIGDLKSQLQGFNERLSAVESRLTP